MGRRRTSAAWRALVSGHAGSGLTVAAYCARERICQASFYRWRLLLGDASADRSQASRSSPVRAAPEARFVDLGPLRPSGTRLELRLDLGDGLVLQISRG